MSTKNAPDVAVRFEHVKKYFPAKGKGLHKSFFRAVDDVSFTIRRGEILTVVGESGCGKSTLAKMLCRLYDITDGTITVDGQDISKLRGAKESRGYTSKVQMIFQDPFSSLNPAQKTGRIVARAVELHNPEMTAAQVQERVRSLFETVGLTPAADFMAKHPNQLSGGQRQRIVIARALAANPSIVVADEPTSMLDVSIGIEIMNLMLREKEENNLTYLFITHNLASARYMADRMAVMYAGNCVELGDAVETIARPLHPYTVLLLNSSPEPFREEKIEIHASEERPDLTGPASQCPFAPRCPLASDRCRREVPQTYAVGDRQVKCFLYESGREPEGIKMDASIYASEPGGEA